MKNRLITLQAIRTQRNQGTTIIMVTHDSQVAAHTERMMLLKDGKIQKEKPGFYAFQKASKQDESAKETLKQ